MPLAEDRKISLNWQGVAYVMLTLAEILISVTGLELAFVVAPPSMKSLITAVWQLTVFAGNFFINAPITLLYDHMEPPAYFGMLAVMLVTVAVAAVFVGKRFNALAETAV